MTDRPRNAFDRAQAFAFAPEDSRRLAAMRIGLFSLLAWRLAVVDVDRVAGQPAALFDPVSVFHLLSEMPSQGIVDALRPLGIIAALRISGAEALRVEVEALLERHGLPVRLDPSIDVAAIIEAIARDKKADSEGVPFVLVERPGTPLTGERVDAGIVRSAVEEMR